MPSFAKEGGVRRRFTERCVAVGYLGPAVLEWDVPRIAYQQPSLLRYRMSLRQALPYTVTRAVGLAQPVTAMSNTMERCGEPRPACGRSPSTLDLHTTPAVQGHRTLMVEEPVAINRRSTQACSARCRATAALSIFVSVLVPFATGCDAEEPKPADKPAASAPAASTTTMPAATTAAPKKEEPEEDPAANIECQEGAIADFHNEVLEAEIRRKLQKPEGDIKVAELRQVRSVNLARDPKEEVDYLDPCIFPHLTNVKDLFLGRGKLKDISLLSKLTNLESLRVSMNQVSDVSPLSELTKLDRLDLGYTQVTDVSPLAKLTSLTELQLDNTKVSDISALASLEKLERLSIQRTDVSDISPLKPLKELKFLYIGGSRVDDPYAIARPGLKVMQD